MSDSKRPTRTDDKVRVTPLVEQGKVRGYQFEHRDGRKAAVVRPETVRYTLSAKD